MDNHLNNMEFLTAYGLRHKELHSSHEKSWTSKTKIKIFNEETPKFGLVVLPS